MNKQAGTWTKLIGGGLSSASKAFAPALTDVATGHAKQQLAFQKRQLLQYVQAAKKLKAKVLGAEDALRTVANPQARSHIINNVSNHREELDTLRWLHGHLLTANKNSRKMYRPYIDVSTYRPGHTMRKISEDLNGIKIRIILARHFQ